MTGPLTPLGDTPLHPTPQINAKSHYAGMAVTLRLTEEEQAALRQRAQAEGVSMQEAARRAVREYVARGQHRDRVMTAAEQVITSHGDALDHLGR
jgi:hypothetical protein